MSELIENNYNFIKYLEKFNNNFDPIIEYIKKLSFDGDSIIKCPIETIILILYENIEQVKNKYKLFKYINAIYNIFYKYMKESYMKRQHIICLCAKYDFKEYFLFIASMETKLPSYLFAILVLNNSQKIYYYLLSNCPVLEENIPSHFYHQEKNPKLLSTLHKLFDNKEYKYSVYELINDDFPHIFRKHAYLKEYNYDQMIQNGENKSIQLLKIYNNAGGDSKDLFSSALNMAIRCNYYELYSYLNSECFEIFRDPKYKTNPCIFNIKVNIFNIIKANNVEFISELSESRLIRQMNGIYINKFNDDIKEQIRSNVLYDTITSIEMLDIIMDYFGEKYQILDYILGMCGNIEIVMAFIQKYNKFEFLSTNIIKKLLDHKCSIANLSELLDCANCVERIPDYIFLYVILYKRNDLYEYLLYKYKESNKYYYIDICHEICIYIQDVKYNRLDYKIDHFVDYKIDHFVDLDVDYISLKINNLLLNKMIDLTFKFIKQIIQLCFINVKFVKLLDLTYDYILVSKIYTNRVDCECDRLCHHYYKFIHEFIITNIINFDNIEMQSISHTLCDICNSIYFNYSKLRPIIELCRTPIIILFMDEKYVKPARNLISDYQKLQKKLLSKILLKLKIKDIYIFEYIFEYIGYLELKMKISFGMSRVEALAHIDEI